MNESSNFLFLALDRISAEKSTGKSIPEGNEEEKKDGRIWNEKPRHSTKKRVKRGKQTSGHT